jgi:hypothetical protein
MYYFLKKKHLDLSQLISHIHSVVSVESGKKCNNTCQFVRDTSTQQVP